MDYFRSRMLQTNWSEHLGIEPLGDLSGAALQAAHEEGTTGDGERWVLVRDIEDTAQRASYTNTFNLKGELRQQEGMKAWSRTTREEDASDLTCWTEHTLYVDDIA